MIRMSELLRGKGNQQRKGMVWKELLAMMDSLSKTWI